MLCSLLVTQRSTAARAQSTDVTSAPEATAVPIELISSFGGTVDVLGVESSLAYVGEGGGVRIVDVGDPTQPSKRGYLPLPDFPLAADVVDNTAYIAASREGLQIADVSNADSPQLIGSYPITGTTINVQVAGSLAYVLVGDLIDYEALHILDVSDSSQPTLRGTYRLPYNPTDLEVVGSLAYVTLGRNGLQIVDVSNPASPTLRGSFAFPDYATSVAVSGNRAYVADSQSMSGNSGLTILDVSNPASPAVLGTYKSATLSITDIQLVGNLVYLVNRIAELQIVDVSNPASPALRSSYTPANGLKQVFIANNRAYLTVVNGMEIVDVSNPASPALRGAYDTLRIVNRVYSAGSFVYLVGAGLHILDTSDPARPRLRGSYPGPFTDVQVAGNLAYIVTNNSLQILNVANPDAPMLLSSRASNVFPGDILVRGNLAYVSGISGLDIFDVSDPSQPTLLGSYTRQFGGGNGLDVAGNFAYLTSITCGVTCGGALEIVDVSNPSNPTRRGVYRQLVSSVKVLGNRAYVTTDTVEILDISDPDQPQLIDTYESPGHAIELQFQAGYAYIADGYGGGLHIAAVTNLDDLQSRATYKTAGETTDLHVVGNMVYLANAESGLKIFRIDPTLFPSSIFVPLISRP